MTDKFEKDKSWGTIVFNRCYGGGGIELFGSDIENNTYIELTIKHAQKCRSLGRDFTMGDDTVVQVKLSPLQFSELLTNMNVGDGVPCTIKYTQKDGFIEYKPEKRKIEIISAEREKATDTQIETLETIYDNIVNLLDTNKIPKTQGREIADKLSCVLNFLKNGGSDFLRKQSNEEIENMILEAKTQVSDYVNTKIFSVGLEKLLQDANITPKLLTSEAQENDR